MDPTTTAVPSTSWACRATVTAWVSPWMVSSPLASTETGSPSAAAAPRSTGSVSVNVRGGELCGIERVLDLVVAAALVRLDPGELGFYVGRLEGRAGDDDRARHVPGASDRLGRTDAGKLFVDPEPDEGSRGTLEVELTAGVVDRPGPLDALRGRRGGGPVGPLGGGGELVGGRFQAHLGRRVVAEEEVPGSATDHEHRDHSCGD